MSLYSDWLKRFPDEKYKKVFDNFSIFVLFSPTEIAREGRRVIDLSEWIDFDWNRTMMCQRMILCQGCWIRCWICRMGVLLPSRHDDLRWNPIEKVEKENKFAFYLLGSKRKSLSRHSKMKSEEEKENLHKSFTLDYLNENAKEKESIEREIIKSDHQKNIWHSFFSYFVRLDFIWCSRVQRTPRDEEKKRSSWNFIGRFQFK